MLLEKSWHLLKNIEWIRKLDNIFIMYDACFKCFSWSKKILFQNHFVNFTVNKVDYESELSHYQYKYTKVKN